MKQEIAEIYQMGLEKYAGDAEQAKEFTTGFLKAAFNADFLKGVSGGVGAGVAALGLGLGVHGLSSMMNSARNDHLREKFNASLNIAIQKNPLLVDADRAKVTSYAKTVFDFAPNVAADPNLLSPILAHAVQGEGMDITIVQNLTQLEGRLVEARKNSTFTPKMYV